jgi:hypothetical protein
MAWSFGERVNPYRAPAEPDCDPRPSTRGRVLAVVLGIVGFFGAYFPLVLVGNWIVAGRVAKGQSDLFGEVLLALIAGTSATAGGATSASINPVRWCSGSLPVGAVAASYFLAMYAFAGALVPYLAALMTVTVAAALAGGWLRYRLHRRREHA